MPRQSLNDLLAFLAVARERSFTKAAAKLGVSQSALSHTIRGLEARLGLRLLTRTTRSVAPTEAGERLLADRRAAVRGDRGRTRRPQRTSGQARRHHPHHGRRACGRRRCCWPKLAELLPEYPDIKVEIIVDYGLTDIVAERYDAGVRYGEQVAKDMIAVRIAPDMRMAVVGAPSYFAKRPRAEEATGPSRPHLHQSASADLRRPLCLGVRKKGPRTEGARRTANWFSNPLTQILAAALAGIGLAFVPEDLAAPHVAKGTAPAGAGGSGARRSRAITSIIRAAANPRRPLRCWSTRCAIASNAAGFFLTS